MNTSWSPLKLVNTYGAFGSIGKVRTEVGHHSSPPRPSFHLAHFCLVIRSLPPAPLPLPLLGIAIGHPASMQVIIQGTSDGVNWLPYEFPCKPGDVSRRPCTIAPYHYRMDWKMYVFSMFCLPHTCIPCRHCCLVASPLPGW